ncbi:MAG: hypothetical protein ACI976_003222, partial [Aureispira sp.]
SKRIQGICTPNYRLNFSLFLIAYRMGELLLI